MYEIEEIHNISGMDIKLYLKDVNGPSSNNLGVHPIEIPQESPAYNDYYNDPVLSRPYKESFVMCTFNGRLLPLIQINQKIVNLPAPKLGHIYIISPGLGKQVSLIRNLGREDIYYPRGEIRDADDNVIGYEELVCINMEIEK